MKTTTLTYKIELISFDVIKCFPNVPPKDGEKFIEN